MSNQYFRYPVVGGSAVPTYPNFASLPATASDGAVAVTTDTDTIYVYNAGSTTWVVAGGSGIVNGVGTFDSGTPSASGAHIDANKLIMQSASASNPGLVNTGSQTLAGQKTFSTPLVTSGFDTAGAGTIAIGTANATSINIGNAGSTVNIQGTVITEQSTTLNVTNPVFTVNAGAGAGSGSSSGMQVNENNVITGYVRTSADRNSWQMKAPNTAGVATLAPGASGITLNQSSHDPVTLGTANGLSLATQVLSLGLASAGVTGALSGTDWSTFNNKQPAGTYVTSLTVTTANGISGSFTAGATPALTLTLGAITPSTVNGNTLTTGTGTLTLSTFTVTATATANIGGTNTGDITLGAIGASANANGASLSGQALTLQPASGSFGGVVTTGTQTFAGTKTFSSNPTFSAMTTAGVVHNAVTTGALTSSLIVNADITNSTIDLTAKVTGTLPEANGGTNQSTYATGDLLYASGANTLAKRAIGSSGQRLVVSGGVPTWATPTAPTVQKFTTANTTGTYTTPAGVLYLRIRAVGGGGGGAGSGTGSTAGNGAAGGTTDFGGGLISCSGGAGGLMGGDEGGAGGTATVTGPTQIVAVSGAGGGAGATQIASIFIQSGYGGNSYFGGGGSSRLGAIAGVAGATATGSGGSGGGISAGANTNCGAGGGAGGYAEAYIFSPSATYSWQVASAGTAGTAGTSGSAGGAGAGGQIVVEEYYQ